MEIIEKIRAEIATHENEIARLRSALQVIEKLSGKTLKNPPLITVSGVSHQKPTKAKSGPRPKPVEPKVPIEKQIIMLFRQANKPMRAAQMMRQMDCGTLHESTVYYKFKQMQEAGQIEQNEKRFYGLPGMFNETGAVTEEAEEAA